MHKRFHYTQENGPRAEKIVKSLSTSPPEQHIRIKKNMPSTNIAQSLAYVLGSLLIGDVLLHAILIDSLMLSHAVVVVWCERGRSYV